MNRIEDIVSAVKLEELKNMVKVSDLLQKKEDEEKKKCICKWGIALIGVVVLAVVAFAVYKYLSKDNMDDFDDFDDFDDYDDRFHQQMKLTMVLLPYIHRKIWKMLLKL